MKNKLIVFEGIDGVGKSSIAKELKNTLISRGISAVIYEDVEDKKNGFNQIKPFVKSSTPINSSLLFYLASGIYKSEQIKKMLAKSWVICDRYIFSTLSFHYARRADRTLFSKIWKLPIIKPDYYFLVKTKEEIRLKRICDRSDNTKEDFIKKEKDNKIDHMERELESFAPIIIENNESGVEHSINKIIEVIFH